MYLHQSYQITCLTANHILPKKKKKMKPSNFTVIRFLSPHCILALLPNMPGEKAPRTFLTLLCQTHLSCASYFVSVLWQSGLRFEKFSTGNTSKHTLYLPLTSGVIYQNCPHRSAPGFSWQKGSDVSPQMAFLSACLSLLFPQVNLHFPFRTPSSFPVLWLLG